MRFYNAICFMLVFALAAGAAHADGPTLQVIGYSTTPATVYAGTSGQLQLTLSNGGTDTATRIAIYYDNGPGGDDNTLTYAGDIGPGTTTMTSIPFSVPSNDVTGILLMHISISYSDSAELTTKSLPLTASIPVAQHEALEVKTLAVNGTGAQPGDKFTAVLEILNRGGVAKNAVLGYPANSSFAIDGTSRLNLGDIPLNGSKNVSVGIRSASTAQPGKYMVPLVIEYQDAAQNTISQAFYVGPATIMDSSAQFRIELEPVTPTEVGSEAQFELTVENRGSGPASATIDLNQSTVFTPLGNSRIYIDDLGPGQNWTGTVTLGVGAATDAGYYTLPITITSSGRSYDQDIGITVSASQELTMSASTTPSFVVGGSSVTVDADIANTGNSPIRSVYVKVRPPKDLEAVGTSDKFVGTLNVDDFTTFQFTVNVPDRVVPGNYTVPVMITFKDSTNQGHTVEKDMLLTVYSPADAARLGGIGGSSASETNGFAARRQNGGFFGISVLTPMNIGAGVIVAAIGYFGYKKFRGGKK